MSDLQGVLEARRERIGRVRTHLHEPPPTSSPASQQVVQALPRLTLGAAEATVLHGDGAGTCPICLAEYLEGEEVVCMPCNGLHKAHWACMGRWLEGASTCPTCRFALPAAKLLDGGRAQGDGAALSAELLERAVAEV